MKKIFLLTSLVALIACAVSVSAAPSFLGPTGLFLVPTADTLSMGSVNAFGNFINTSGDNLTNFGANIGVGFGLEAGVTVFDQDGTDTAINAKWKGINETLVTPAAAVGVIDITDSTGLGSTPYVVASKSFSVPTQPYKFAGHLGYAFGDIKRVFLGAEATISPKLSIIAETFDGDFDAGIRYAITPGVRVDAAILDGDFGVGASYSFGLK